MPPVSIGPYQIVRELGRGGMGVIYLATDPRLDRRVAIKSLPSHLAADPDRLARFQREAKVLASLNHSNVGALYGLEESAGQQYLVLEFIEGETLADRFAREGTSKLPFEEALAIAKQIAEGLEAAHEKGIIHRDLKPANIMVTPDGAVKVLDFGLARTADGPIGPSSAIVRPSDAPTLTSPGFMPSPAMGHSPTIPGVIMGTAGYMSPEQARGKPVDKRTDIFSFGCVLGEMLTGDMLFRGDTVADAIGATLHKDLDLAKLPANTPQRVRDLLTHCLSKDRKYRLHDIADARLEIDRAIQGQEWKRSAGNTTAARSSRMPSVMLAVASACALSTLTWFVATGKSPPTVPPALLTRTLIASQGPAYYQATDPQISPDGKSVLFVARSADRSSPLIWVRPLDSFEARPLPKTDGAMKPFWSYDSQSVAFFAEGKLWAVGVGATSSRRLIAAEPNAYGTDWGPDGSILYTRGGTDAQIMRIPAGGGHPEPVTTLDPNSLEKAHVFPRFLPDGQHFLYTGVIFDPSSEVRTGQLYVGRVGSTEKIPLGPILSKVAYVETGNLVYVEDGTVKSITFDAKTLKVSGDARVLADGVAYFRGFGNTSLSVANDGTFVYQPSEQDEQLVAFDLSGKRLGTVGPRGALAMPRFSPDGQLVAVSLSDRHTGYADIWMYGVERPTVKRLTTDAREEAGPVWSRDGSRLYFSWDYTNTPDIFTIKSDGTGPIDEVYGKDSGGNVWVAQDLSPDGQSLIVRGNVDKLGIDLRVLDLQTKQATPFCSTPANEQGARFSPDGRWVAYVSDASEEREIYLTTFPQMDRIVQVSSSGGINPMWAPDGKRLYYLKPAANEGAKEAVLGPSVIMAVDLTTPEAFRSPSPPVRLFDTPEQIGAVDLSPDGKRFVALTKPRDTPPIHLVLNGVPRQR